MPQIEKVQKLNRILMGKRVAEIDSKAIAGGIDSKKLMKNAGIGIAMEVISDYGDRSLKRVPRGAIICGGGNNGGDGFVIALHLLEFGYDINIYYIVLPDRFSPDSSHYYNKLSRVAPDRSEYLMPGASLKDFAIRLGKCDFIIDAIFGTGLHGDPVREHAMDIIEIINSVSRQTKGPEVYAVDIPSGIDSDNGKVLGNAVYADKTITFGCKKVGNINYPGADFNGRTKILDIGIPADYYGEYEQIFEPSFEWVVEKIPKKHSWTYKHQVGKLLVVAGSLGFTGAASMACMGALRSGAGLVTLVCPEELNEIFEEKLTEVITYPVKQTDMAAFHFDSLDEILELAEGMDAVVMGPGVSRDTDTIRLIRELVKKIKIPVLLDADGLQALRGPHNIEDGQKMRSADLVITPHAGELSSILGLEEIALEERLEVNEQASRKFKAVSVLKGARTVISDCLLDNSKKYRENSPVISYINTTGNWGMASAGTGDILSGIIGSLLCQGMIPIEAAVCGTYIHGLAADIICKRTSRTSLIATDLLDGIKEVFLKIEKIKYAKEI